MRGALLVALVCALLPRAAAGQEEEPRGRPEVSQIRISGNTTFETDSLKRAIVNRETECRSLLFEPLCGLRIDFADSRHYFHAEEFPRDAIRLQLYYWQRGYRQTRVDTASLVDEEGEVELDFTITEGRPVLVDSIAVLGTEAVADQDLLDNLPLEPGDPLSVIAVQATRDTLENRLHDAGYAHALVLLATDLPFGSYSARVTFDVDPGPRAVFGPIEVTGNIELEDEVILRMIGFQEGQQYSTTRLLDAQRNIFGLELVQYARVDTLPTSDTATVIPTRVEITEGYEYRVRGGAGWSTAECMNAEARWSARNFMGGARRLQVRARLSNVLAESLHTPFCTAAGVGDYGKLNWLLGADFNQPWIFSPRNSLSLGIYGERTSLPEVFVRTAVGVNVGLVRSLGRATPLSLSYRPQLSTLDAAEVYFCTSFLACERSDIEILQGANWLAPVGANISTDQTDNLLNPRAGYRFALDLEHASPWTGSNYAYNRAMGEASVYRGLGSGVVGATRIRLGWVEPGAFQDVTQAAAEVVHPQKRFFSGGSNSVRGYAQGRLGPKVLTVNVARLLGDAEQAGICTVQQVNDLSCDATPLDTADVFTPQPTGGTRLFEGNVEIRFPVGRPEFEGVVFADFGQVWAEGQSPRLGDLALTPGVGTRYYSVIGPIRLDLGYRTTKGEQVSVVTSRVRACTPVEGNDDCIKLFGGGGFERLDEIALLRPKVPFEGKLDFLQRLQLHFSIGQAF